MQPINRYCRPPTHPTKWTVVLDDPREGRTLRLFDTQAEAMRRSSASASAGWRTCLHCRRSGPAVAAWLERPTLIQRERRSNRDQHRSGRFDCHGITIQLDA
jgi:hypothetical protein